VVVDFFTTWCGPCKQIAPLIESLALKYPEVKFLKVDIEKLEDLARARNISSIPTFHFIVKGKLVDEMKGANPADLEAKVVQYKVQTDPFGGSAGNKSGSSGDDPNVPALSAREARLKAFAAIEGPRKPVVPAPVAAPSAEKAEGKDGKKDDCDDDEALSKALSLSLAGDNATTPAPAPSSAPVSAPAPTPAAASKSGQDADDYAAAEAELALEEAQGAPEHFLEAPGQDWEEEMVPVPVNEELLAQLTDMGFSDVRARKSLVHGGSLDGAVAWMQEHEEDADIDQPYMVRYIDTLPKAPLTEEEKASRSLAIRTKIVQRKQQRAKQVGVMS
jgi:thioredoxin